jgi:hypothetical protein
MLVKSVETGGIRYPMMRCASCPKVSHVEMTCGISFPYVGVGCLSDSKLAVDAVLSISQVSKRFPNRDRRFNGAPG